MMGMPPGTQVWLAAGVTDMRKSFDGLSATVQSVLERSEATIFFDKYPFEWPYFCAF